MAVFIARLFLRLLNLLPAGGPWWLARKLAPMWMKLSPVKHNTTIRNLERCFPEMDKGARDQVVKESFVHYVAAVLEAGHNWYCPTKKLVARCDEIVGRDAMNEALESERGVMILAPHCGAWEYLGIFLQQIEHFGILYKPPSDPRMDKALVERRKRAGGILIPANASGVRTLFAHLNSGQAVGVLPDQEPSRGQGRFAPFFGVPALTGVLAAKITRRTNCHVFSGFCERLAGGRYRVHFIPADDDIHSENLDVAMAAVNRGVEQCARIDLAQYLWSYKRFKTRPEGEPPFYS